MKTCPKCHALHTKNGTFCSRSCANSRKFSPESIELKKRSNLEYYANLTADQKQQLNKQKIEAYDFAAHQKLVQEKNRVKSWSRPYEQMHRQSLRKRVLHERNYKCEACGISNVYNGKPLSLELDHIDGDNTNNKIENLRILCPNCHSQTPTHRAKNIRFKKLKESVPR